MIMTSPLLLDPPTADGSALSGRSTAPRNRSKKLSTVLLVVLLVAAVGTAVWQTQRARELQQRVDAGMALVAAANSLHDKPKWTNAYPDARTVDDQYCRALDSCILTDADPQTALKAITERMDDFTVRESVADNFLVRGHLYGIPVWVSVGIWRPAGPGPIRGTLVQVSPDASDLFPEDS
jgi:hypothetical protein